MGRCAGPYLALGGLPHFIRSLLSCSSGSASLGPTFFIAKKVPFDFAKDEGKKARPCRPHVARPWFA